MPPLDDKEQDLDSSSGSETLDAGKVDQTEPTGADSSAAQDDADKSVLSIVRDVVGEKVEPEPAAASSAEGEEVGQSADDPAKTQDDENYSDVPFNKHPRFQQLLTRVKTSEADAKRYQNVQTYLDSNGVSSEEAADALLVAALAKTNPAKAWEQVRPWLNKLLVAAGEVLPDELQQRVQAGELTRDAALEVSRSRATVQSFQTQRELEQQRQQREAADAAANSILSAATSWEQDRQQKDPNFAAKVAPLQREIAYLHATEGRPTTPEGVKDQLTRAYKAVNDAYVPPAAPRPTPRPVRPVTGGQVSGSVQPVMNSILDIVKAKTRQTA
jgi:hypothetical protein